MKSRTRVMLLLAGLATGVLSNGLDAVGTTLAWDPPANASGGAPLLDTAGYKIHYGTASRTYSTVLDVGPATTATLPDLTPGQTYFITVTSYDTSANESAYAEELIWTQPPPAGILAAFSWDQVPTPQTAGRPFPATLRAVDDNGMTVTGFAGPLSLYDASSTRIIRTGTKTSAVAYPMPAAFHDARTQVIYLRNEIGPACTIRALALDVREVPGQPLENWTIRLKHTPNATLTRRSAWEADGWTTVYRTNQTVSTPGWVEFVFSTPFHYNGTDHLMVDFSFDNRSGSRLGFCLHTATDQKRRLHRIANSTYGDPLTWRDRKPTPSQASTVPILRLQCDETTLVHPAVITGFVNGVWTGDIIVAGAVEDLALRVRNDAGLTGVSNPFDVRIPTEQTSYAMASELPPLPETDFLIASDMGEPVPAEPLPLATSDPGITRAGIAGIPPMISLMIGDGKMKMGIQGTVGADILLQSSTNITSPFAWETLHGLLLTNAAAASDGATAPAARNTLEAAFVPAFEWVTPETEASGPIRFFRAVMPYNYAVLADKVLKSKGYQTRLVVVRLPGTTLHDVCYVGEDRAYIAGSEDHYLLAMNYSGATIRDIANDYSGFVKMNWTSASEFVFADGRRQLVATVVKIESPSSDPSPASLNTPAIAVDF